MSTPAPGSLPPETAEPWHVHSERVRSDWIDYNGHMNVAFYVLVFDHGTDALLDRLGLGADYRAATGCSVFVAEAHVTYEQEVSEGDALSVVSRILDFDCKRIILFHEMMCPRFEAVVASNEVLCLNVDLSSRRTAPLPTAQMARVRSVADEHARLPRPGRAGRAISLKTRRAGS